MSHELSKSLERVKNVIKSETSVNDGMNLLLDYCQNVVPNPTWETLRKLDFEKDTPLLKQWIKSLLKNDPPSDSIVAFWFGLSDELLKDGSDRWSLYVIGSTEFDPRDTTGDWACITDESWQPEGRYANSAVLTEISRLLSPGGSDVNEVGDYVLCLGFAGLTIKAVMNAIDYDDTTTSKGIAVGFDEGDFIILRSRPKKIKPVKKVQAEVYEILPLGNMKPGRLDYAGKKDQKGFSEFRFFDGKSIDDWPEGVQFYVRGTREDDLSQGAAVLWTVVSGRVKEVFERCNVAGVQYLPVRFVHIDTEHEYGGYWALNVFQEVDALDWDNTTWVTRLLPNPREADDPIFGISIIALRSDAIKGHDIFRLSVKGKGGVRIYISDRLRRCLNKAKLTGFRLGPVRTF